MAHFFETHDIAIDDGATHSGGSENDTVIYDLGADNARGGGDDRFLMILEDYVRTDGWDFSDFIFL